ncbi:hypothetical protein STH12_00289 [Shewanella khirikhana]|uniref:Uncharacterized protein n=1 Tax=Shewanella khirikhana TaxID=1965282 RepID=A0ABM7CZE7_9GAMM|nr:hypothetical protein STH12_00289 [Shewanella khirikhana]
MTIWETRWLRVVILGAGEVGGISADKFRLCRFGSVQ